MVRAAPPREGFTPTGAEVAMQALVRFARRTALRPVAGGMDGAVSRACGIATTASARSSEGLNAFLDPARFMPEDKAKDEASGREWQARELRLKSFDDLHALWYVLLKEKNMLLTEKHAARANRVKMRSPHRIGQVRRTMARIKLVLSERAIEDAGDDLHARARYMRVINAK